ncbi:hypothetical protein [Bradyrhizobium sp. F1.13.3]|uniref:hypothetical protein n=1 Tax=Bradyrhizobium sp. F1.13.3 TaxID=3156351 RepID=UPI003399E99B
MFGKNLDTYINPRHVIRARRANKNEHGAEQSTVHLIDGTSETVTGDIFEVADEFAQIIPAFPGFEYIYAAEDNGVLVELGREPIIAWRCNGTDEPTPITASGIERSLNSGVILDPKGNVIRQGIQTFDSVEDWLNAMNDDRRSA